MRLHTGTVMASSRGKCGSLKKITGLFFLNLSMLFKGILMTVGQLAFYDEVKTQLLKTGYFKENVVTHFTAAVSAASAATVITMPLDVLKTRLMNAKPGEYAGTFLICYKTHKMLIYNIKLDFIGILDCFKDIMKNSGAGGFFKGTTPAFIRLGPHTVITFLFLEQLKKLYVSY